MTTEATFFARVYLIDNELVDLTVWNDELEPMCLGKRSVANWVEEHLTEMELDTLRSLLGISSGDHQCVFSGTITGWVDYYGEYDEEVIVSNVRTAPVPRGFPDQSMIHHEEY